jgi:biopolymer transport protein ExbB
MMVPLAICSVVSIAVVLDRWRAFRRYSSIDNRSLTSQVIQLIWEDDVEQAAVLCANTPGPISAVLLAGIQAYDKAKQREDDSTIPVHVTVKDAMDDYSIRAISAVEKRFAVLSTVGNAAPLIGMTGTVLGMIATFDVLSSGGVNNEGVAAGISEALVTTASGLIVALLAVIPFNYFNSQSDAIDLSIEEMKAQFVDTVAQVR